ncbi:MAG: hypothetical protein GY871_13515 [Actinomycetales bacterium]|nr:hypothetical protein [Actinomycetales bacterium]MCP4895023.1 hypothetical protein [Actinomycetales bacterium]
MLYEKVTLTIAFEDYGGPCRGLDYLLTLLNEHADSELTVLDYDMVPLHLVECPKLSDLTTEADQ